MPGLDELLGLGQRAQPDDDALEPERARVGGVEGPVARAVVVLVEGVQRGVVDLRVRRSGIDPGEVVRGRAAPQYSTTIAVDVGLHQASPPLSYSRVLAAVDLLRVRGHRQRDPRGAAERPGRDGFTSGSAEAIAPTGARSARRCRACARSVSRSWYASSSAALVGDEGVGRDGALGVGLAAERGAVDVVGGLAASARSSWPDDVPRGSSVPAVVGAAQFDLDPGAVRGVRRSSEAISSLAEVRGTADRGGPACRVERQVGGRAGRTGRS